MHHFFLYILIGLSFGISFSSFSQERNSRECYKNVISYLTQNENPFVISTQMKLNPTTKIKKKEQKILLELTQHGGSGRVVIKEEIILLSSDISEKALEQYEKEGSLRKMASGSYQLILSNKARYIEILSPPQGSLYGSLFPEIFEELKSYHLPVLYYPEMTFFIQGQVEVLAMFHVKQSLAFIFRPNLWSDEVNLHELQHVKDIFVSPETFFKSYPVFTKSFLKMIEKLKKDQKLNRFEEVRISHGLEQFSTALEMVVNKNEIVRRLSSQGLKNLIMEKNKGLKVLRFIHISGDYSYYNFKFLYHRFWVGPLDPYNFYLAFKIGIAGYIFYKLSMLSGTILAYGMILPAFGISGLVGEFE